MGKLTQTIDDTTDAIAEFTIEKMPDTSSMTSAVKGMFSKFVGNENGMKRKVMLKEKKKNKMNKHLMKIKMNVKKKIFK